MFASSIAHDAATMRRRPKTLRDVTNSSEEELESYNQDCLCVAVIRPTTGKYNTYDKEAMVESADREEELKLKNKVNVEHSHRNTYTTHRSLEELFWSEKVVEDTSDDCSQMDDGEGGYNESDSSEQYSDLCQRSYVYQDSQHYMVVEEENVQDFEEQFDLDPHASNPADSASLRKMGLCSSAIQEAFDAFDRKSCGLVPLEHIVNVIQALQASQIKPRMIGGASSILHLVFLAEIKQELEMLGQCKEVQIRGGITRMGFFHLMLQAVTETLYQAEHTINTGAMTWDPESSLEVITNKTFQLAAATVTASLKSKSTAKQQTQYSSPPLGSPTPRGTSSPQTKSATMPRRSSTQTPICSRALDDSDNQKRSNLSSPLLRWSVL